jgi:hypothetical protein
MLSTPQNGMKTSLQPSTPEFGQLEYALQISLHASTAQITSAYHLSNPVLASQFDTDIMSLDAWVSVNELSGANTEEEVIRRGFQFSNGMKGLKVGVGSLAGKIKAVGDGMSIMYLK